MKKTSWLPSILITAFGVLMASLSLYFMLEREEGRIRSHTFYKAHELRDSLLREFLKAENVLRGIEGLLHSSENVTRNEFRTFCKNSIDEEIPLHLVEWQPKVLKKDRVAYEKQALKEGIKGFQFFEINDKGQQVPAKERDIHFPVYYSYSPVESNQAVGLDLAFSPERMESKFKSMQIGKPVSSGTFDVIVKDSKVRNPGFAITYPVFNDPTISSSDSLNHLRGFMAIVLFTKNFFLPLTKFQSSKNFQFEVRDYNGENQQIFKTLRDGDYVPHFGELVSIDVGNRRWDLITYPTTEFIKSESTFLPWVIWSLIILMSFGLSTYIFLKSRDQKKISLYERQIQQKQKLESLGVLASGIAHEFNNILHCVTLAIEDLKSSQNGDLLKDNIETTMEYCNRGRDLIRQILSFARQDSGVYRDIIPSTEIEKSLSLIRSTMSKEIEFELEIEKNHDTPFWMNANHLSQILINLCNNASHAMGNEGKITIIYRVDYLQRVLIIKDYGSGIGQDIIGKIFDPFFTTKSVNEGTGLGLSVIYGIVKSYNGDIFVSSEEGKGSEFKVVFPNQ